MPATTIIKQATDQELPNEIIATAILSISDGVANLRAGRLNDRALVLLIQNASPTIDGRKVSVVEVRAVLDGIRDLAKTFIRPGAR